MLNSRNSFCKRPRIFLIQVSKNERLSRFPHHPPFAPNIFNLFWTQVYLLYCFTKTEIILTFQKKKVSLTKSEITCIAFLSSFFISKGVWDDYSLPVSLTTSFFKASFNLPSQFHCWLHASAQCLSCGCWDSICCCCIFCQRLTPQITHKFLLFYLEFCIGVSHGICNQKSATDSPRRLVLLSIVWFLQCFHWSPCTLTV